MGLHKEGLAEVRVGLLAVAAGRRRGCHRRRGCGRLSGKTEP
uniref:Uncharacterized protein n=1 Tax=Arundo donax TaxID=35708 RepID=A0A0A9BFY4_ARUDO